MLSYKISDASVRELKRIGETAAEKSVLLSTMPEDKKEAMRRYAMVSQVGSTTRIENAVLTDVEVEWMDRTLSMDGRPTSFQKEKAHIEDKLSKERERSIEEVAGCRNMLAIVYSQAEDLFPLTRTALKGLHQEMLKFHPPASHYLGRYKVVPNNVVETFGTEIRSEVLKTADPGPITEAAMRDLVDWYNAELPNHLWPVAVAAEFVFRFLAIHPFQDGNGRLGRAFFNLALLQCGDRALKTIVPYLALDRHIEQHKEEYYLVLKRCSGGRFLQDPRKYHIELFLKFMAKMLSESLGNDIDHYAGRYDLIRNLAGAPKTALECFRDFPERRLAIKDIVEHAGLPRRTAIHALKALLTQGLIVKTGKGPAAAYRIAF